VGVVVATVLDDDITDYVEAAVWAVVVERVGADCLRHRSDCGCVRVSVDVPLETLTSNVAGICPWLRCC